MADFLTEPVPTAIRADGRAVVTDVLAAAVAGSVAPGVAEVAADARFAEGAASILGTDRRVAPPQAAMTNTAAAIAQEIEEGHDEGGHVGAGVVAGGLAAAEANDLEGAEYVDACIRAYEICVRLERAIFAMKDRINEAVPWLVRDPHSTWTTVGPAVTSALCLQATPAALLESFRIAANVAVVSMHDPYVEGAPSRNFTAGFSAQAGLSAAQAAIAGLEGSRTAIEAVYDPFEELLPDGFATQFDTLGTEWAITQHYSKPYPSCRYTHAPLDALRDALATSETTISPDAVAAIEVETFANGVDMAARAPETATAGKFSTPYVLATYLTRGSVELDHFSPAALRDPVVRSLAERVTLSEAASYEAAFPASWGASATVKLHDGRKMVGKRAQPRGDHRDPLSDATIRARDRASLTHGLGGDIDRALEALDAVDRQPVRETVGALRAEVDR